MLSLQKTPQTARVVLLEILYSVRHSRCVTIIQIHSASSDEFELKQTNKQTNKQQQQQQQQTSPVQDTGQLTSLHEAFVRVCLFVFQSVATRQKRLPTYNYITSRTYLWVPGTL